MIELNKYGTIEQKIRTIAERIEGVAYMFADFAQANVELDKIEKPTILHVLPASGKINLRRDVIRDKPETQIWFLCPSDFDFEGDENDCRIEVMKRIAYQFIYELNKSELFEQLEGDIPYQVAYDAFDVNLTGVCIMPTLIEIDGLPICDGTFNRKGWDELPEED